MTNKKILIIAITIVALPGLIYYVYPRITRPDTMTIFWDCVSDMDTHHVDALKGMSFCGGILKEDGP